LPEDEKKKHGWLRPLSTDDLTTLPPNHCVAAMRAHYQCVTQVQVWDTANMTKFFSLCMGTAGDGRIC
jgi:hypothetical protein